MSDCVHAAVQGTVGVLTLSNPPVNALSSRVLNSLLLRFRELQSNAQVKALVITGAGATFAAGFDIRELQHIQDGSAPDLELYGWLDEIENSAKPVVMAIAGLALGGGLELAMSGHYRFCSAGAKLGQPEVNLGLIPGMAGTQRLPRLVGAQRAIQMCSFGEPVSADDGLRHGLVDRIVDGDLLAEAIAFASTAPRARPTKGLDRKLSDSDPGLWDQAHALADRTKRSERAPHAAADALKAAVELPFSSGCAEERRLFRECLHGSQSKALIHVFFGERTAAKFESSAQPKPIRRVGVLGAGTMGSGISLALARAGFHVVLKDTNESALARASETIRDIFAKLVAKGKLSSELAREQLDRIQTQLSWDGFECVDLVIEAVFEDIAVKQSAMAEAALHTRPDCILASNTSTLDIDSIASPVSDRTRVAGLHFFSPANVMRLVEVIRGSDTSDQVISTLLQVSKVLGKIPVLVKNSFGFIGNRMMLRYLDAAYQCVEAGAGVEQVNDALVGFGMRMGPFAMEDQIGLDVTHAIRAEAKRVGFVSSGSGSIPDALFSRGRHGQKAGKGWFSYGQDRRPQPDADVEALLANYRSRPNDGSPPSDDEIVKRCTDALADEGRRILADEVAARASDIDIVWVHGYGFPAWRGGPMFYAGDIG